MGTSVTTKVRESATCRCGRIQSPTEGPLCRSCGTPLQIPFYVYRRNAGGEWEPVAELDFKGYAAAISRTARRPLRLGLILLVSLVFAVVLWGWWWKWELEAAQRQAEAEAYAEQGTGIVRVELEVTPEFATGGKLVISGRTNLPEGTLLEARVRRQQTVLAQDYPIAVSNGTFRSRELANRGRAFRPGEYELDVLARFTPSAQPESVFARVGPGGKKLTGSMVESTGENPDTKQVAFRVGIRLN